MSDARNVKCVINGDTGDKQISVRVKPAARSSSSRALSPGGVRRGAIPCLCRSIKPPICHHGHVHPDWGTKSSCWMEGLIACERNYKAEGPKRRGYHHYADYMPHETESRSGGDETCVVEITIKDNPSETGGHSRSASGAPAKSSGSNHEFGSKVGSMFSGGRSRTGSKTTRLLEAGSRGGDGDLVSVSRAAESRGRSRDAGGSKAETIRAPSRMSGAGGESRIGSRNPQAMSTTRSRNDVLSLGGSRASRVPSTSGSRARNDSRDNSVSRGLESRMSHLSILKSRYDKSRSGDDGRSQASRVISLGGGRSSRAPSERTITGRSTFGRMDDDDDMAGTGGLLGMRGERHL